MFRKMRRFKQELSKEECVQILKSQNRAVLSVLGDDNYPYGIPINFWFDEESGNFCFHGARSGHKIDAIEKCDKVSICVMQDEGKSEGEWFNRVKSVIAFGRLHKVTDEKRIMQILEKLTEQFPTPEGYLQMEIEKNLKAVQCLELETEHLSGKIVKES